MKKGLFISTMRYNKQEERQTGGVKWKEEEEEAVVESEGGEEECGRWRGGGRIGW